MHRKLVRFGLVVAGVLSVVAGAVPAIAQDVPSVSFSARIVAGTCEDSGQETVVQLADLTYGLGEETGTDTAGAAMVMAGSPETVLVATGVTQLEMTAQELTGQPHAVAILASSAGNDGDPIACGVIGGVAPEQNLFFGLPERDDSGYAGISWLNTTDDRALLTLMLTSLAPPAPALAPATATPGAATPTVAASPVAAAADAAGVASPVMVTPVGGATTSPGAATPTTDEAAAETVTIESVDIDFIPDEVTIPANTDVTIELPNNGTILHTFVINDKNNPDVPNLDIRVEMAPGSTEQVTVNAPAGDYYYWCDIPGHEPAGMYGTLHVSEG